MNVLRTSFAAIISLFSFLNVFGDELPLALVNQNDLEAIEDGWMMATSGDPFLVFDAQNGSVEESLALVLKLKAKHVLNRQLYVELFWATDTHGFAEELKGFYIQPFNVDSEKEIPIVLNLGEFLQIMEDAPVDQLRLVRIDFDPRIYGQDFRVKAELSLVKDSKDIPENARFLTIHPPYRSKDVMDLKIFKYTVKSLLQDFAKKFFRDPVFLVLYLGSIFGILFLIIYVVRAPSLFGKKL